MSIKFTNIPSLEGMDAQITPVLEGSPLCRIPAVRALYGAVTKQKLMDTAPGETAAFVLAFEEGLKQIVFANLDLHEDRYKLFATVAKAVQTAVELRAKTIFVPVGTAFSEEEVSLICQALLLGAYRFDLYKGEKGDRVKFTVYSERDYSEAVAAGKILAESTNFARDLVNTAPSDMTPILLAQKAAAQAEAFRKISDCLSEKELAIFKRGRNAHPPQSAKNASSADYHAATGLEALFGWLYLSDMKDRAAELFKIIAKE